jgi:ABC-type histidine transport system ATPase subunit
MATFWTEAEVELDVNDIYENLSDREILKLVDLLVDEGVVISTNTSKNESMSFLDEEWKKTLLNLMNNRHRLSNEDEETIKTIANKL